MDEKKEKAAKNAAVKKMAANKPLLINIKLDNKRIHDIERGIRGSKIKNSEAIIPHIKLMTIKYVNNLCLCSLEFKVLNSIWEI